MELDKAFQFAVVLAWEDLMKTIAPRSVRVELVDLSASTRGRRP